MAKNSAVSIGGQNFSYERGNQLAVCWENIKGELPPREECHCHPLSKVKNKKCEQAEEVKIMANIYHMG